MNILVFQHLAVEHPGIFRDFWNESGHRWHAVELDAGESIPDLAPYDLLVAMGGPMDVWQEEIHPWLAPEKAAIRRWVRDLGRPYLGICLGHQLRGQSLADDAPRGWSCKRRSHACGAARSSARRIWRARRDISMARRGDFEASRRHRNSCGEFRLSSASHSLRPACLWISISRRDHAFDGYRLGSYSRVQGQPGAGPRQPRGIAPQCENCREASGFSCRSASSQCQPDSPRQRNICRRSMMTRASSN